MSTTRLGTSPGNAGTSPTGTPTANEAIISTTRSNIKRPDPAKLPNVGVTVTGPGGGMQLQSDADGVTPLGKLPVGTTRVEFNGEKVAETLRSIGGSTPSNPGVPAGIRCRGCFVIPIIMLKADGEPVVSIWNGDALPNKLQALLRIGRDGNLMDVDWGSGPQPVQPLTKVGVGTLSMTGSDGPVPVSPALLKMLQDRANKMTPGLVEANNILMDVSATLLGTSPGNAGTSPTGTPTANEAIINTTRSNIKKPPAMLPDVGVTATGPNGTQQLRSDGQGWTRFGKLPIGNTVIEFNGADLASALKTTGAPLTPTAQQNHIELLVVIAIIAIKTDGTPVVFTGSVPGSAVKTLKADLRIGRDGNAMAVDWGNGPQLPQVLPRTGAASLTVPGPNGPIPLDPAFVKSLQDRAVGSAPGLVESNTLLQEVSTTKTGPLHRAMPGRPPRARRRPMKRSSTRPAPNIKKPPAMLPDVGRDGRRGRMARSSCAATARAGRGWASCR